MLTTANVNACSGVVARSSVATANTGVDCVSERKNTIWGPLVAMTGALIDVFKKEAFALKRCVRLKKSLNYKNRLMSRRHVGNRFLNLKKNVWHLQKNMAVNVNTTSRTCAVQQFPVYD